jgi:hypothetical protein
MRCHQQEHRGPRPSDISIGYLQRLNASLHLLRDQQPEEYQRAMALLAAMVEHNRAGTPAPAAGDPSR